MKNKKRVYDASDCGTGKTFVQIMDFTERRRNGGKCALVFGTKSILDVAWKADFEKFAPDMRISVAYAENREEAFKADVDVYITNADATVWVAKQKPSFFKRFDTLIVDEGTWCKHHTAQRSKALGKIAKHFEWRRMLSGTPNTNGVCDLWHQYLILDDGVRLGKSYYAFRSATGTAEQVGPNKHALKWTDKPGIENVVGALIKDITIRHKFEDCVDIPANFLRHVDFTLAKKHQASYEELEAFSIATMDNKKVSAVNAAVLYSKLLQSCISEGTEVLTNTGWKVIENITSNDQVWDGDNWVNCDGLIDKQYAKVIDCWGVLMTPDHKVLTQKGWKNAESCEKLNRSNIQFPNSYISSWDNKQKGYMALPMRMREHGCSSKPKSTWHKSFLQIMRMQTRAFHTKTRKNITQTFQSLDKNAFKMFEPMRQGLGKLRNARGNFLERMEQFSNIFKRYGIELQTRINSGTKGCGWPLQQRKLCMGDCQTTIKQYAFQPVHRNTKRHNDSHSSCRSFQNKESDFICAPESRVECGKIAHVYDILNAGPNNRFLIRNNKGYEFLVHNCSGAVYDGTGEYALLDTNRYQLVMDLVQERQHSVVFFLWQHQKDQLMLEAEKRGLRWSLIDGTVTKKGERERIVNNYQAGEYDVLFAHPQSTAHGITLTKGTATIWASPTNNLEWWKQGLKRIHRIGQTQKTETIMVIAKNTIDERVWDALQGKNVNLMNLLYELE